MKTLNTLLLSAVISASTILPSNSQTIKERTTDVIKASLYNFIREEVEIPTFEVKGKEIGFLEKEDSYSKTTMTTNQDKKIIYISMKLEKKNKEKNIPEFNNYLRIKESSKLLIMYDQNSRIKNIYEQGKFIKQDFWNKEIVKKELKGMTRWENHEEAKVILKNSEKMLDYLVSRMPFKLKEEYNKMIKQSKKEQKRIIDEMLSGFKDNPKFEIIPVYIPDKLTGQKMIELDYKIEFEKTPKEVKTHMILDTE